MIALYLPLLVLLIIILFLNKSFWVECSYLLFSLIFIVLGVIPLGVGFKLLGYNLGLDNLSLSLIILSIWVSILIFYSRSLIFLKKNRDIFFSVIVLSLLFSLLIRFLTVNLLIFYFFFEVSLIPTLILIIGWGYQPERIQAGIYFLFYTLTASLPLLLSLIYIYFYSIRIFLLVLDYVLIGGTSMSYFFFFAITLAFLVKMPMFLTHLWLPKAHVEAPVSGSIILAGVLLKLGGFGLCRVINLVYFYLLKIRSYLIGLSLVGIMYVGFMCCRLNDIKALIAYSSVSHMALVISGVFRYYIWGFSGCLSIIIAHGISSSGLFCILNIYYERSHSRRIFLNKGLILVSSIITLIFFILCIANISAPPRINLLSEILLMARIMSFDFFILITFPLGSFLGAVFTFYLFSYTQHGKFYFIRRSSFNCRFKELNTLIIHIIPLNYLILVPEMFLIF